jgi:hypothetical protein
MPRRLLLLFGGLLTGVAVVGFSVVAYRVIRLMLGNSTIEESLAEMAEIRQWSLAVIASFCLAVAVLWFVRDRARSSP